MALHVAGLGPPPRLTRLWLGAKPEEQQDETVAAPQPTVRIVVTVAEAFEQALEVTWQAVPADSFDDKFVVEVAADPADPKRSSKAEASQDAEVQKVHAGKTAKIMLRDLQMGRRYMVAVEGRMKDESHIRSSWVRGTTLVHKEKPDKQQNLDPNMKSRLHCKFCSCPGYIRFNWAAVNTALRCRRCGCQCWDHVSYETERILRQREADARVRLERKTVKTLPDEAVDWDGRECDIWFSTVGAFHPRKSLGGEQRPALGYLPGLVSVVCPTTEGRQHFHLWLWMCFAAQSWPDKELVVVETYTDHPSQFLEHMSKSDPRLVYFKHKIGEEEDWSIGAKRNIGNALARGEYIASFDDDDLYAPEYLTTMVTALQDQKGQAIKLSSWYTFRTATCSWGFCDPISWGLSKGVDETDTLVRKLTYGYGFSYVYKRQVAMDVWYEDIDFGEDFAFLAAVQEAKGEDSVLLLRDDYGICLHVQHGANTSNSIHIREVPKNEALDTNVMELSNHFASLRLTQIDSHPAGLFFGIKDPPSKRTRKVRVHFPDDTEIAVYCRPNATTDAFLKELWRTTGDTVLWKVYRVPPPEMAEEEKRDYIASLLLGIDFLAALPGAWMNLLPETDSGQQWRRLLESAKRPLRYSENLGLRTTSIWLLPGEDEPEPPLEEDANTEDYVLIRATCQKTNVKSFSGSFMAWLPRGSTVELLRKTLGRSLPPQGRIFIERKGKGMAVVQSGEVVPERIVVSEYKGVKSFHMHMTRNLARVFLHLMRKLFPKHSVQRQLDEIEREANGHPVVRKGLLGKLLREQLYPEMARAVGLPDNALEPPILSETLGEHISADLEMSHLCLEVDWWIRNWDGVFGAFNSINHHRKRWGLDPLTDLASLDPTGGTGRAEALAAHFAELQAQAVSGGAPPAGASAWPAELVTELVGSGSGPQGAEGAGGAPPAGASAWPAELVTELVGSGLGQQGAEGAGLAGSPPLAAAGGAAAPAGAPREEAPEEPKAGQAPGPAGSPPLAAAGGAAALAPADAPREEAPEEPKVGEAPGGGTLQQPQGGASGAPANEPQREPQGPQASEEQGRGTPPPLGGSSSSTASPIEPQEGQPALTVEEERGLGIEQPPAAAKDFPPGAASLKSRGQAAVPGMRALRGRERIEAIAQVWAESACATAGFVMPGAPEIPAPSPPTAPHLPRGPASAPEAAAAAPGDPQRSALVEGCSEDGPAADRGSSGPSAASGLAAADRPPSPKGVDELFDFGDLPTDM